MTYPATQRLRKDMTSLCHDAVADCKFSPEGSNDECTPPLWKAIGRRPLQGVV